jgi:hypothetical protein
VTQQPPYVSGEGFDRNPEPAPYQPPEHPALKAIYHPMYKAKQSAAVAMAGISKGFLVGAVQVESR